MPSRVQIDQLLSKTADAKQVPGVVALAANGNELIYQGHLPSATFPRTRR
jgi:methyl acetate hydrolase